MKLFVTAIIDPDYPAEPRQYAHRGKAAAITNAREILCATYDCIQGELDQSENDGVVYIEIPLKEGLPGAIASICEVELAEGGAS